MYTYLYIHISYIIHQNPIISPQFALPKKKQNVWRPAPGHDDLSNAQIGKPQPSQRNHQRGRGSHLHDQRSCETTPVVGHGPIAPRLKFMRNGRCSSDSSGFFFRALKCQTNMVCQDMSR